MLKTASREKITQFVKELEKEFELTEFHRQAKAVVQRMFTDLSVDGRCAFCRSPVDGHGYEECVARTHGQIAHLYQTPRKD